MGDQTTYLRAFPTTVERTGPRQLTGRLVPYNVVASVMDETPNGSEFYDEGFRQGAFAAQINSGKRQAITKIGLIHRHRGGLGYLGPFVALREEPDGLYGDINIVPSKAEDVDALLNSGVNELSIEFRLPKEPHTEVINGVRWRTRAHLDQVALEADGAYNSAQVLSFRSAQEDAEREKAEQEAKEAAAAEEAKRREEEEAEAIAKARAAAEAEAEAAVQRRKAWDALINRLPEVEQKGQELQRQFGSHLETR